MMTIAMYIAVTLFGAFHLDPLLMLVPIAAVLFAPIERLSVRVSRTFANAVMTRTGRLFALAVR